MININKRNTSPHIIAILSIILVGVISVIYQPCFVNVACAQNNTFNGRQIISITEDNRIKNIVDGCYVIRFNDSVSNAEAQDFLTKNGLEQYRDVGPSGRWFVKGVPGKDHIQIIDALSRDHAVASVHPDYLVQLWEPVADNFSQSFNREMYTPSDPYFDRQWYLHNTGPDMAKVDADIDAPEGWDIEKGKGLWIAVLDSGIPLSYNNLIHPDLMNEGGNNRVIDIFSWADDFYPEEPGLNDLVGHGTTVTGILAASHTPASQGIAGVVPERAHIVPVKVSGLSGMAEWEVLCDAIEVTVENLFFENPFYNIILNCSWGHQFDEYNELFITLTWLQSEGYQYTLVAGTGANLLMYPAKYSNTFSHIIAVGATSWTDEISAFSAPGPEVTVVAPGSCPDSPHSKQLEDPIWEIFSSTRPDGWNWREYGTSWAAPQVAGLAALLLSLDQNLSPSEVKQYIMDGADFLPGISENWQGDGRISIVQSLQLYLGVAPPSAPTGLWGDYKGPSQGGPKVFVKWDRNPETENVEKYYLERALGEGGFTVVDSAIPDPGTGSIVEYSDVNPPVAPGYWRYRVKAYNSNGWGNICDPEIVLAPPTAPEELWGVYYPPDLGGPKVVLTWSRNPAIQQVNTYWLERAVEEGSFEVVSARISDPGSGSTVSYTDDRNLPSAEYWRYRVRASNPADWGPFCSPIEVFAEEILFLSSESHNLIQYPDKLSLNQNYPNPFNPDTQIKFGLPTSSHVRLQIMNVRGETVRVLVDEEKAPGWHTVTWDGKNETGQNVGSGIYFYLIETDEKKILKKMTLIR